MAAAMQGKNDRHCCLPQCTGNGRLNPELSFHKIPINDELRKSWIHAIRRDPGPLFNISKEAVVCSRHFKKEDFKWTPVRKTLRPSSVPSLFNWSKESTQRRQIIKTPLPQKRRKTDDDATDNDEELGSSNWLLHENSCPLAEANVAVTSDKERIQLLESMIKERDENIERLQQRLAIERFGHGWDNKSDLDCCKLADTLQRAFG
nr:THAP domain-containing protein 6-like [Crassostrea gigas]